MSLVLVKAFPEPQMSLLILVILGVCTKAETHGLHREETMHRAGGGDDDMRSLASSPDSTAAAAAADVAAAASGQKYWGILRSASDVEWFQVVKEWLF